MNKPLLTDGVISLRALEPEDAAMLYLWENDTRLWNVGCATAPFSLSQLKEYISGYDADIFSARQLRLVITDAETLQPLGTADLYDFDPVNSRAGVGILVDEAHRRTGVGLRAIKLLERYCLERLSLHQLWAVIPESNPACRALFGKAGYTISGRLRSWLREGGRFSDAWLYQNLSLHS